MKRGKNRSVRELLKKKWCWVLLAALTTLLVGLITFGLNDVAPFGNKTLAANDANIQYLDFFGYYQNVLHGKDNVSYSFTKGLGGGNTAVFSYYLSSPLMLILAFVGKAHFQVFYNLAVLTYLVLIAATTAYFLFNRFQTNSRGKKLLLYLLAVSFATSQYCINQSCNLMWLAGVAMLPLMLYGVYKLVNNQSHSWLLAVFTALAIFLNWYTAGINCLFTFAWFWIEYILSDNRKQIKLWRTFGKYILAMVIGVLIGGIILLPTAGALRNSSRGSLDSIVATAGQQTNHPLDFIKNYHYGVYGAGSSQTGTAALYVGALTIIFAVALAVCEKKLDRKITFIIMLILCLLMISFYPLVMLFGLLKQVDSFWCRYGYLMEFTLVFMAGYFIRQLKIWKRSTGGIILGASIFLAGLMILLNYPTWSSADNHRYIILAALVMIIVGILSALALKYRGSRRGRRLLICLAIVVLIDIFCNVFTEAKLAAIDRGNYANYVAGTEQQIEKLKQQDHSYYRITQTDNRDGQKHPLFNEPMSYSYWSTNTYNSSPDDTSRVVLAKLGYRAIGGNTNANYDPILPIDSLLGVKYTFSTYNLNGYTKIPDLGKYNGKAAYRNDNALPMGLIFHGNVTSLNDPNTFTYQEKVYSTLADEPVKLYQPISIKQQTNGDQQNISLDTSDKKYNYYCQISDLKQWDSDITVRVNDQVKGGTIKSDIVYVPNNEHSTVELTYTKAAMPRQKQIKTSCYRLNLNALRQVTKKISSRQPNKLSTKNGDVTATVNNAKDGDKLFLSIPYDRGWTITNNGQTVQPELVADAFYTIPLQKGKNNIKMTFKVIHLKIGLLASIVGLLALITWILAESKKHKIE